MAMPKISLAITADDKTAKGFASAEKRAARMGQSVGASASKGFGQLDRVSTRSGRGIVSTFARIERASANIFTGSGGAGGTIASRLSAISSAGEAAAGGLGEAAIAGGVLEATLGAVAVGGALVVGVVAGVAFVTDKLASSWSKNVVGASNYASAIGVATKSLQEFQAAGERVGLDKNTSAGALGGLSETLNDARYGRNTNAAGTLAFLGVKMKLNPDGTVDTMAMLPAIQAAIQRQTSFGARQVAGNLGIGQAGLAIFRNGKPLAGVMSDAERHANVVAPGDEDSARRYLDQRTRVGQMAERAGGRLGAGAAGVAQGVLDQVANVGANTMDTGGQNIVHGAQQFSAAVIDDFRPAVREMARVIAGWQPGGRFDQGKVQRMAHAALPLYRAAIKHGDSPEEAAAWAATAYAESGGNAGARQPGHGKNLGVGLFQYDAGRRADFERAIGKKVEDSSVEDQLHFRDIELRGKEGRAFRRIGAEATAGGKADAITRYYERPKAADRDAADRANIAGAIDQAVNIHHHVSVTVDDRRAHATVKSQRMDGTPIHYAFGKPPV